jgi:hypothetical protein
VAVVVNSIAYIEMLDKDPENRSMKENSAERMAQEGEMKVLLISLAFQSTKFIPDS